MSGRDLSGLRILIARASGRLDPTVAAFTAAGALVDGVEITTTAPPSDGVDGLRSRLEEALRAGPGVLAVASPAAVEALDAAWPPALARWSMTVVGAATASVADGRFPVREPAFSDAAELASARSAAPDRIVAPIVENRSSALAAALADHDDVVFVPAYRTEAIDAPVPAERLDAVHLVAVFAPSGVASLATVGRPGTVLALGATTAAAAAEWVGDDRVLVAERPDIASMVEAAGRWWAEGDALGSRS